jgi:hypothetical protein
VDRVLNVAVGTRLPMLDENRHTNHIACSRYVKLQDFMGFQGHQGGWGSQVFLEIFESFLCFLVHWNLFYFLRGLKKGSPLMPSHEMNLLKVSIHHVNLCTSWRLTGGVIFVIAYSSGLGQFLVGRPYTRVIFLRARQMRTSQDPDSF